MPPQFLLLPAKLDLRMKYPTCDECGARLGERGASCNLCGWTGQDNVNLASGGSGPRSYRDGPAAASLETRPAFEDSLQQCNRCNAPSGPAAVYCSQCGARLESKPLSTPTHPTAIRWQVAIMVCSGLGLVVTLFLVSTISKSTFPIATAEELNMPTLPDTEVLEGELNFQISVLDSLISEAQGIQKILRQREKVLVLHDAGRTDLAAAEQHLLAQSNGALEDWKLAGDLFYDAMATEADPNKKQRLAGGAVLAYEQTLAMDVDNIDVQTDLATAYLNTGDPMKGVAEIKKVLETDPNHLNANFNYGLMLARISRLDQAVAQFEKVRGLAAPESEHYRRASEVLADIQDREAD